MIYLLRQVLLILLGCYMATENYGQNDWEIKKEKDGIKVYLRDVEGSNIQEYKAEAILYGKVSSFIAVMKDVNSYKDLYDHAKEVKLLFENDTSHIHYLVTDTPWPVKDRDAVYSNTYRQHYDTKLVRVDVSIVPGYMPENDDYVRMKKLEGYWMFYQIEPNKVEVTYQMHAEPGGSIPGWVINMFLVDTPIEDMKRLQERVKLEKYANRKFDFLVE